MPKRIALKDKVVVNSVDLSTASRSVTYTSEHARIDVSGFNASGTDEFLAGATTQSITVEFYGSYGAGEVHQTIYPIHASRSIVAFEWRIDQTSSISATNPALKGNVQVLTYSPAATRGEADTYTVEFTSADATGLAFFTT